MLAASSTTCSIRGPVFDESQILLSGLCGHPCVLSPKRRSRMLRRLVNERDMTSVKVALVGDGGGASASLGSEIAQRCLDEGFDVHELDILNLQASNSDHGSIGNSRRQVSKGAMVLLVVVSSANICEYLTSKAISVLANGGLVLICSPLAPSEVVRIEEKLSAEGKDLLLVDAPVSRALDGGLKVVASGTDSAIAKARDLLSAIDKDFLAVEGGLGTGSKLRLVEDLLYGVHLAAAAESVALGACAGLNTKILYDIISNAAGNSKVFAHLVPCMLNPKDIPLTKLDEVYKQLGLILDEAKVLKFPLPLTAAAHQQVVIGCASGYGNEICCALFKNWEKITGACTSSSAGVDSAATMESRMEELAKVALKVESVSFVGLGAMGFGMATNLVKEGFKVRGYDVYGPSMERFFNAGGTKSTSPEDCAKGAKVLILMVANEQQAESVLFGEQGAVQGVSDGCTVVLCSTVSPAFVMKLEARLAAEGRDLHLIDAPVSGGTAKAATGALTIMAAGSEKAFKRAGAALLAMGANVYIFKGGGGPGSSVKMVNQLLAGVHIAVSAEAMAFGARLGLESLAVYKYIEKSDGSSWMFTNRVPHMLNEDYTPLSAVDIFVKDMGIVFSEGKRLCVPLPVASSALQQYLLSSAAGWGRMDDSAVVKVFEKMTGVSVKSKVLSTALGADGADIRSLSRDTALNSLPPEWSEDPLDEIRGAEKEGRAKVLVVLDDDPTGTQTVHGVTVLTDWGVDVLKEEFEKKPACFFILTNSRALNHEEAALLTADICKQVVAAASAAGDIGYTIVLRGDSTLRGHFPQEPYAAASVIGESDAWIICPFFLQGGRYTINDIHYIADGSMLVPAGKTEFAQDAVFGYKSSNLREWVEEKTEGKVAAKDVSSISIELIRKGGPDAVCRTLCALKKGSMCVVNAASERDVEVFAAGMIRAEAKGKQFLCRTAAAFVSARIGLRPKAPLTPKDLGSSGVTGGLIVIGSYVPKTTKQVEELRSGCKNLEWLTVDVAAVTSESSSSREVEIEKTAISATLALTSGIDSVIMTSRDLVTGRSKAESLRIGLSVSTALVEIVKRISVRPRYLLAKGGITSSDVATKGMNVRKALVIGQALPGVPLWEFGPGSRYPGLPYIVFPGNVGGIEALANIVQQWSKPTSNTTQDMLQAAKIGGYAVGAFNVYNIEGILALVAAAEAERSPAILQIHPASLEYGGMPLVAACVSAAKYSSVPISVHLDHGDQEKDILHAICSGFDSVMVDGSKLSFRQNIQFTKSLAQAAHAEKLLVEAELGRLSGMEDGLTVEEYESLLTDTLQAEEFLTETKVDALAVCIGNVHGKYPPGGPNLNLDLLKDLNVVAERHNAVLVLHGASGVPDEYVKACIARGVTKFNVNTEVRGAYMETLKTQHKDLVDVLRSSKEAMQKVIVEKLRLFGSSGKAT